MSVKKIGDRLDVYFAHAQVIELADIFKQMLVTVVLNIRLLVSNVLKSPELMLFVN